MALFVWSLLLHCVASQAVSEDCQPGTYFSNALVQLKANLQRRQQVDIVHVLSMGREASCFVQDLVSGNGSHPSIFEPLGGVVEGEGVVTMSQSHADAALQCLYDCHNCTEGVVNKDSYMNLQSYCEQRDNTNTEMPYLVVKTTRIVDHGALVRAVPKDYLAKSRLIVLLRDPRGVWASTKPYSGWAIHSIPLICELLALQALTLPELAAAVGPQLLISIYEQWTLDTGRFSGQVAKLLGESVKDFLLLGREGQRAEDDLLPPSWVDNLTYEEKEQIENDGNCAAYMHRVGYVTNSSDTSQIKGHEGLVQPLLPEEAEVLERLRRRQTALQTSVGLSGAPADDLKLTFVPANHQPKASRGREQRD